MKFHLISLSKTLSLTQGTTNIRSDPYTWRVSCGPVARLLIQRLTVCYWIARLMICLMSCWLTYVLAVVFKVFDKDNDSFISLEEWIRGMSIYLRGTKEEQINCKDRQSNQIMEDE